MVEIGIALSIGCAATGNVAMLCKHRGARQAPAVTLGNPIRSVAELFRSRWWTIGFLVAALAWALHVAAIALAPLSLVTAVVAGGIVLIAYPAERYFGHSLGRRELLGLVLAGVGLAFLALTVPEGSGSHGGYSVETMIAFELVAIAVGLALLRSARGDLSTTGGALLGAAAGLLIGVANVAIKALTEALSAGPQALISPWTVLVLVAAVAAFFALARGMQLGEAIPVIAATSVVSSCAAILGGVIVFGDPVGSDLLSGLARGTAFGAVILATALIPAPLRAPART
jgi:hypothetical protein